MKTLEQYLKDAAATGVIDHSVRAQVTPQGVTFYIHPAQTSGDTLDFKVLGNDLRPAGWQITGMADIMEGA